MQAEQELRFGPYRFTPQTGQLWRGKQEVKLTPKALVLLQTLVTRSEQVVTKDQLFQAVWPQTVVSDDALTSCMQAAILIMKIAFLRALRKTTGDL